AGVDTAPESRDRLRARAPPCFAVPRRVDPRDGPQPLDDRGARLRNCATRPRRRVGLVPGLARASDGLVRLAPHLGLREERFAEQLSDLTGLRVAAANDASLGCRAEYTFGAGTFARHALYVNGGASGIGGGMIIRSCRARVR